MGYEKNTHALSYDTDTSKSLRKCRKNGMGFFNWEVFGVHTKYQLVKIMKRVAPVAKGIEHRVHTI